LDDAGRGVAAPGVVRLRQVVAARTSAPPVIASGVGVSPCISQTKVGLSSGSMSSSTAVSSAVIVRIARVIR
jgi:hypothetical protein